MLIAMAGLPGCGKSSIAARLAAELGGVVLSKDEVRRALFPPLVLDHSAAENDITMAAIFHAAAFIHRVFPRRPVIIDGRTFLRSSQLRDLEALAESSGEKARIIECVCAEEIARARLEQDLASGTHPAGNRTFALYLAVKEKAEPIQTPHLVLDTGVLSLDECVQRCLQHLRGNP
jgi:predicted kinase